MSRKRKFSKIIHSIPRRKFLQVIYNNDQKNPPTGILENDVRKQMSRFDDLNKSPFNITFSEGKSWAKRDFTKKDNIMNPRLYGNSQIVSLTNVGREIIADDRNEDMRKPVPEKKSKIKIPDGGLYVQRREMLEEKNKSNPMYQCLRHGFAEMLRDFELTVRNVDQKAALYRIFVRLYIEDKAEIFYKTEIDALFYNESMHIHSYYNTKHFFEKNKHKKTTIKKLSLSFDSFYTKNKNKMREFCIRGERHPTYVEEVFEILMKKKVSNFEQLYLEVKLMFFKQNSSVRNGNKEISENWLKNIVKAMRELDLITFNTSQSNSFDITSTGKLVYDQIKRRKEWTKELMPRSDERTKRIMRHNDNGKDGNVILVVDGKEFGFKSMTLYHSLFNVFEERGITYHIKDLPLGDYLIGFRHEGKILYSREIIERKSLEDFGHSHTDDRLKNQLAKYLMMRRLYGIQITYIIEKSGKPEHAGSSEAQINSFVEWCRNNGINVWVVNNKMEMTYQFEKKLKSFWIGKGGRFVTETEMKNMMKEADKYIRDDIQEDFFFERRKLINESRKRKRILYSSEQQIPVSVPSRTSVTSITSITPSRVDANKRRSFVGNLNFSNFVKNKDRNQLDPDISPAQSRKFSSRNKSVSAIDSSSGKDIKRRKKNIIAPIKKERVPVVNKQQKIIDLCDDDEDSQSQTQTDELTSDEIDPDIIILDNSKKHKHYSQINQVSNNNNTTNHVRKRKRKKKLKKEEDDEIIKLVQSQTQPDNTQPDNTQLDNTQLDNTQLDNTQLDNTQLDNTQEMSMESTLQSTPPIHFDDDFLNAYFSQTQTQTQEETQTQTQSQGVLPTLPTTPQQDNNRIFNLDMDETPPLTPPALRDLATIPIKLMGTQNVLPVPAQNNFETEPQQDETYVFTDGSQDVSDFTQTEELRNQFINSQCDNSEMFELFGGSLPFRK